MLFAEQSNAATTDASRIDAASKVDFLIDICCALLVCIRGPLLDAAIPRDSDDEEDGTDGPFARCMRILQDFTNIDPVPVLELAYLYRQRRLASALTGDGPSVDDEDEGLDAVASVTDRAARMYKNLKIQAQASPQLRNSRAWFGSVGRSFSSSSAASSEPQEHSSTPTASPTPSRSRMFQRYAEVLQSSDAAASLSKIRTNLAAQAMTTFNKEGAGQSTSSPSQRLQSFSIAGQDLMSKARNVTASTFARSASNPSEEQRTPSHPAVARFSRADLPQFPLPNVVDTPSGKEEYVDTHNATPAQSLRAMFLPHSPASGESGSQPGSPRILPSMRARQPDANGSIRANGPKPLLLTPAAKPARDISQITTPDFDSSHTSRKISTGPLASHSNTNSPVAASRKTSHTANSSVSTFSSRASSDSAQSRPASGDSARPPAVKREAGVTTVPASAFAKARQAKGADTQANLQELRSQSSEGTSAPLPPADPLEHLPVARSSSEGGSKLQRARNKRGSSSFDVNDSSVIDLLPTQDITPVQSPVMPNGPTVGLDAPMILPETPVVDGKRVSLFEKPRAAPVPPPTSLSSAVEEQEPEVPLTDHARSNSSSSATVLDSPFAATVERFKLSDAPVPAYEDRTSESNDVATATSKRQDSLGRSSNGSANRGKLTRIRLASRRTNSGSSSVNGASATDGGLKERRSVTRMSSGLTALDEPQSDLQHTSSANLQPDTAGGTDLSGGSVPEMIPEGNSASSLHIISAGDSGAASELPSPGRDVNMVLTSEELMSQLERGLAQDGAHLDQDRLAAPGHKGEHRSFGDSSGDDDDDDDDAEQGAFADAHSSIGAMVAGSGDVD